MATVARCWAFGVVAFMPFVVGCDSTEAGGPIREVVKQVEVSGVPGSTGGWTPEQVPVRDRLREFPPGDMVDVLGQLYAGGTTLERARAMAALRCFHGHELDPTVRKAALDLARRGLRDEHSIVARLALVALRVLSEGEAPDLAAVRERLERARTGKGELGLVRDLFHVLVAWGQYQEVFSEIAEPPPPPSKRSDYDVWYANVRSAIDACKSQSLEAGQVPAGLPLRLADLAWGRAPLAESALKLLAYLGAKQALPRLGEMYARAPNGDRRFMLAATMAALDGDRDSEARRYLLRMSDAWLAVYRGNPADAWPSLKRHWEWLGWAAQHSGDTVLLQALQDIYAALENESHKVRFLMDLAMIGRGSAFTYLFGRISDEEITRLMRHSSAFTDFLRFAVDAGLFAVAPDQPVYPLIGDGDAAHERAKRLLKESGALNKSR